MARKRPAVRCSARRKRDGAPCLAWAIVGGRVCRMHGGGSLRVRRAADRRQLEEWAIRTAEAEQARHRRRLRNWWTDRLVATAEVLDLNDRELAALVRDHHAAGWACSRAHWLRPDLVPSILEEPKFKPDRRRRLPARLRDC